MRKLLAQKFLLVRREVDNHQAPARTQHARRLTDRPRAVVEEVQHLMQDDDIEGIIGERQIVNVALPDAAVSQARPLEAVARKQQHVEREIDPEAALNIRTEHFKHAAGAGTEIEQRAEWLVGQRHADRVFHRRVSDVELSDTIPLGGVGAEVSLRGGGTRLPHRRKPFMVAPDGLVAWVETLDERAGDIRAGERNANVPCWTP